MRHTQSHEADETAGIFTFFFFLKKKKEENVFFFFVMNWQPGEQQVTGQSMCEEGEMRDDDEHDRGAVHKETRKERKKKCDDEHHFQSPGLPLLLLPVVYRSFQ